MNKKSHEEAAMQAERAAQAATAKARDSQHTHTMAQFAPAPQNDTPSLTLKAIQQRLGLALTHGNLDGLGFKTSSIAFELDVYKNDQFIFICDAIVQRVQAAKRAWEAEKRG